MANPNDKPKTDEQARKDAGDPRTSGQPEQFLQEAPAHLAAQGDKAPPMPNAIVRRYFKMHDKGGAMLTLGEETLPDGKTKRPVRRLITAGSVLPMDPALAAQHSDVLTEVDANGQPLAGRRGGPDDRMTTDAQGITKR